MKCCVLALDRLIKDEYHEIAYKEHDEKWGELQWSSVPTIKNEYGELVFNRKEIKDEKDKEQERLEFLKCCRVEEQLRQRDIDTLFETMRKNILGWWD